MSADTRERLLAIAEAMQTTDIRLAYNEEDDSTEVNEEAAHFLKYNEKRVGRDIELYAFMGEIEGDIVMLCDFLGEVIMPLNLQDSPAAMAIQNWGCELMDEENWGDWLDLFKKEEE